MQEYLIKENRGSFVNERPILVNQQRCYADHRNLITLSQKGKVKIQSSLHNISRHFEFDFDYIRKNISNF